jgi:hypothetical protein
MRSTSNSTSILKNEENAKHNATLVFTTTSVPKSAGRYDLAREKAARREARRKGSQFSKVVVALLFLPCLFLSCRLSLVLFVVYLFLGSRFCAGFKALKRRKSIERSEIAK